MSETPRTDEREFAAMELKPSSRVVYASLARQLETELAEARAEIERKDKLIEQMRNAIENQICNSCTTMRCGICDVRAAKGEV